MHRLDGATDQDLGSGGEKDAEPTDGPSDTSTEAFNVGPKHDGPDAASDDALASDGVVTLDSATNQDLDSGGEKDAEPTDGPSDGVVVLDLQPIDVGFGESGAAACGVVGAVCQTACSWGDDVDIGCRHILVCQYGTLGSTRSFNRCGTTAGNACPATQPAEGAACTLSSQTCSYSTGTCTCATGCESGTDAGLCPKPTTWHCAPPPPTGCPIQAPQLGVPCSGEGTACGYGSHCANTAVSCQGGYWEPYGFSAFGGCA